MVIDLSFGGGWLSPGSAENTSDPMERQEKDEFRAAFYYGSLGAPHINGKSSASNDAAAVAATAAAVATNRESGSQRGGAGQNP